MEHIIQFGVSIDEQKIIDQATYMASKEILKNVESVIKSYTSGWQDTKLDQLFREMIAKTIKEHQPEIIEAAINRAVSNMMRTNAAKKLISDALEGVDSLKELKHD